VKHPTTAGNLPLSFATNNTSSMRILLVSATQLEIQEYLVQAQPHHDVLITGVGIAVATFELTHQLNHHHYDAVVQAGVAGAFSGSGFEAGDVVAVERDALGDTGVYEKGEFKSLHQAGLSLEKDWMVNHTELLKRCNLPTARAITVSTITDDAGYIAALQQRWQPQIESMEGAALHMICLRRQIPFVQIRAISNMVGERNKDNWRLGTAISNLNEYLRSFISLVQPVYN